jgi:hypothetical protein
MATKSVSLPITPIIPDPVSPGQKVTASAENSVRQCLSDLWTNEQAIASTAQTPWTQNVDAANHSLTGLSSLGIGDPQLTEALVAGAYSLVVSTPYRSGIICASGTGQAMVGAVNALDPAKGEMMEIAAFGTDAYCGALGDGTAATRLTKLTVGNISGSGINQIDFRLAAGVVSSILADGSYNAVAGSVTATSFSAIAPAGGNNVQITAGAVTVTTTGGAYAQLTTNAGNMEILYLGSAFKSMLINADAGNNVTLRAGGGLEFDANGKSRMTIDTAGHVAINTPDDAAPALIVASINAQTIAAGANPLSLNTSGTARIYVTAAGNVGIGNTTPGYPLDVTGDIRCSGVFRGALAATPTPWTQNIDGGGHDLSNAGTISTNASIYAGSVISAVSVSSVKPGAGGTSSYMSIHNSPDTNNSAFIIIQNGQFGGPGNVSLVAYTTGTPVTPITRLQFGDYAGTMTGIDFLFAGAARASVTSDGVLHAAGVNATLAVYANNAAAVAGGLAAGRFYRNGADPDVVCVVH